EGWNGEYYYAEDGRKFGIRPVGGHELKPRWLWWILANTVFNPIRKYCVDPVELGLHPISEIKETILKWVDSDDDILTQFLDGRQIEYLLEQAKTFDGVVLA